MICDRPINLFQLPQPLPSEECLDVLLTTPIARLERIISTGQTTPPDQWYDQDTDEWVVLLQGQAQLTYADGSVVELGPGDHQWIPAHHRHRVTFTSDHPPCIWLAAHFTTSSITNRP